MSIKGITTDVRASFPDLGRLRKGAAKPERGPGKDLDHFRFTAERPEVQAAFEAAFTSSPRQLTAFLPYAKVEDCFDAWREQWGSGSLAHRCDGETMQRWRKPDGTYSQEPAPCPYQDKPSRQRLCKPVGRLRLILPQLLAAGYVGYVTLATTSIHDIRSITAALLDAKEKRGDNPNGLKGIEWLIWRQETAISVPREDGTRVRMKKWLIKMAPTAQWVQALLQASRAEVMGQLPAPANGVTEPEEYESEDEALEVDPETGEIADDDTIDGEATEVQPQAPLAETAKTNIAKAAAAFEAEHAKGNGKPTQNKRLEDIPRRPTAVRDAVAAAAEARADRRKGTKSWREIPATVAQLGLLNGRLSELLEVKTEQDRRCVIWYLTGCQSSKQLNIAQAAALLDWLLEEDAEGQRQVRPLAKIETKLVWQAANVEQGQATMDIPPAGQAAPAPTQPNSRGSGPAAFASQMEADAYATGEPPEDECEPAELPF